MEETKVADIELIEETLKQAISYPNTMLKFIQAAIPRLNEHSEGGTSDAENHTNGGRYFLSHPLSLYFISFFIFISYEFLSLQCPQSRKQAKKLKARKTDFKP